MRLRSMQQRIYHELLINEDRVAFVPRKLEENIQHFTYLGKDNQQNMEMVPVISWSLSSLYPLEFIPKIFYLYFLIKLFFLQFPFSLFFLIHKLHKMFLTLFKTNFKFSYEVLFYFFSSS